MAEVAAHCASFVAANAGRNSSWCHHGYLRLRGDGKATIVMQNDSADTFVGTQLTVRACPGRLSALSISNRKLFCVCIIFWGGGAQDA